MVNKRHFIRWKYFQSLQYLNVRSAVKMGNLNPYYNESFVFIVEQEQLRVSELIFNLYPSYYYLESNPGDWYPSYSYLESNPGDWYPSYYYLESNPGDWYPSYCYLESKPWDYYSLYCYLECKPGDCYP